MRDITHRQDGETATVAANVPVAAEAANDASLLYEDGSPIRGFAGGVCWYRNVPELGWVLATASMLPAASQCSPAQCSQDFAPTRTSPQKSQRFASSSSFREAWLVNQSSYACQEYSPRVEYHFYAFSVQAPRRPTMKSLHTLRILGLGMRGALHTG